MTTPAPGPTVEVPGKLFLAGEYAVLEGGTAVLAAVSALARARYVPGARASSPLAEAVVEASRAALGGRDQTVPAGACLIDTSAFFHDGHKLGLGSSAAAAVAGAAAFLEYAGISVGANRELVCQVADAAHRRFQGQVGSGADVATSTYGGFLAVRRSQDAAGRLDVSRVVPPPDLHLVAFWTGNPAKTVDFVGAFAQFRDRAPAAYQHHLLQLNQGAAAFLDAFSASASAVVKAAADYHRALLALGTAAKMPIVTAELAAAADLARALGGAAKPSGAGGGDVGLAFFAARDARQAFIARCPEGVLVLDIGLGVAGATRTASD